MLAKIDLSRSAGLKAAFLPCGCLKRHISCTGRQAGPVRGSSFGAVGGATEGLGLGSASTRTRALCLLLRSGAPRRDACCRGHPCLHLARVQGRAVDLRLLVFEHRPIKDVVPLQPCTALIGLSRVPQSTCRPAWELADRLPLSSARQLGWPTLTHKQVAEDLAQVRVVWLVVKAQ